MSPKQLYLIEDLRDDLHLTNEQVLAILNNKYDHWNKASVEDATVLIDKLLLQHGSKRRTSK